MSMILMIHTEETCREYVLPSLYNSDYSIVLPKDTFDFSNDITLYLENVEHVWRFSNHSAYMVLRKNQPYFEQQLQNGNVLEFLSKQGERAAIIVCEREEGLKSFQKYDVSHVSEITIGKSWENTVVYDFHGLVSRKHGLLYRKENDWFVKDYSANGIFFQWKRINKEKKIAFGERVFIFGLELLLLGDVLCINGVEPLEVAKDLQQFLWKKEADMPVLKEEEKREMYYHRSPRMLPTIEKETIMLEFPMQEETIKQEEVRPLIKLGNFRLQWKKKKGTKQKKQEEQLWQNHFKKQLLYIKETYQKHQRILRENYPSATVCCDYDRNTSTLWNRNFSHKDILFLRLGLGQRPFELKMEMPEKVSLHNREQARWLQKQYQNLTDVPIGIDLLEHRLCGLVGGKGKQGAYEVARIMLAQICANVCYTDVKIAVFYNENSKEEREQWEFVRWLPHIWNEERNLRFLATSREEAREVFHELAGIFRKRLEGEKEKSPHFILFLAEPEWLDGELLEKYVYNNQPEYGVSTCLLVENYEDLPNCCGQVIQKDDLFSGMYHVMDGLEKRKEICFDSVSLEKWEQFSKCLAEIKVKEEQEQQKLPEKLGFLEMYGVDRVNELPVENWWRKKRTCDSMRVRIGKQAGGRLCFLDLHENYHGPHGLLAGTTGAGKSELILTFLLSLSLNFSPKDISFLLIDYKGGGMAQHLKGLPHLAGNISNLSEHGIRRAMVSIQSEIKRRQKIFLKHKISHIHAYTKMEKNGKIKEELPHLYIVVDEFAELKKEEPEFLRELISVAQVGRSLGIHLFLATQKPGGTIDENIWSNSHFRICLRVQDEKDSMEVLKKTDAAFLTQPGQGYLQVGNDEVYERFQTGWSGGVYGSGKKQAKVRLLTGTGREVWTVEREHEKEERQEQTELSAVVEYVGKIAMESGIGTGRKLWLPLLPETLLLEQVEEIYEKQQKNSIKMNNEIRAEEQQTEITAEYLNTVQRKQLIGIAGLCDDPEEQRQIPFLTDFTKDGHCCVIGTVSSGKSSVLQSIVWSLLKRYNPDSINLYLLDFGGGMLSVFEHAPQVGGVILEEEAEKLEKFIYFLQKSISARKELLQGANYVQHIQNAENTLPAIVIVLDNMAAFREATEDSYTEQFYSFLREGAAYGIYFVIAANGFGVYDIPGRMQDFLKTTIALGLTDKYKYMEVLNIPQVSFLPPKQKTGSGLVQVEGRPLEIQIALAGGEDVHQRGELLKRWCHKKRTEWKGVLAKKIPEIPKDFYLETFAGQKDYIEKTEQENCVPVGYHRMEAQVLSVKPGHNHSLLITGTRGSGRKNAAKVFMYGAIKVGAKVSVFGTNEQGLKEFAEKQSVAYMDEMCEWSYCLAQIVKEQTKIVKEQTKIVKEQTKILEEQQNPFQIFIIEDIHDFMKQIYEEQECEKSIVSYLENILDQTNKLPIYWVVLCNIDELRRCMAYPAFVKMTRKKTGLFLGGKLSEQSVFSYDNLSFEEAKRENKAGMGYVFFEKEKNTAVPVVAPEVKA